MRYCAASVVAVAMASWAIADAAGAAEEKPRIDIVFCVDCSGSMGPVIETAKQKVWQIVNEMAKAKPTPELRIGLLGYGDSDRTFRQFDLSGDLDEVYRNLMVFHDEGWGTEFVGLAVHKAAGEMHWGSGEKTLKVIFVVGNETAHQGEMDYTKTAKEAAGSGIVVNAIYCGDVDREVGPATWSEMAKLGGGRYMEIAGTGGAVAIATPYDKDLAALGEKLNATYLGYGAAAPAGAANQVAQDKNAAAVGGTVVAAQRAVAKSSTLYNNAGWDLVDASKQKEFKWEQVKDGDLPKEMQAMSQAEREAFVAKKGGERADLQKQIQELSAKRDAVVKEEIVKQGLTGEKAFDENVKKALVEEASAKGFTFEP